jgi:hypothetical protein
VVQEEALVKCQAEEADWNGFGTAGEVRGDAEVVNLIVIVHETRVVVLVKV